MEDSKDTPCDIKAGDDSESVFQGQQGYQTTLPGHQLKNQGSLMGGDQRRVHLP